MLTARDLIRMTKDVESIILDWSETIQLWNPLPLESQTNWNVLMREMIGPILYNKLLDVPAERRDIGILNSDAGVSGTRFSDNIRLCLPTSYINSEDLRIDILISGETLFILDNNESEPWYIVNLKNRQGEIDVLLGKITGGNINNWKYDTSGHLVYRG